MTENKIVIGVLGDVFCDIVCTNVNSLPQWNSDTLSSSISMMAGGSALNTLVHASAYMEFCKITNIEFRLFSAVGDDSQGSICRSKLIHPLIKSEVVVMPNGERTGTCVVITNPTDRAFVTDRGCVENISLSYFNVESLFRCNHIHLGGMYNCRKLMSECASFFPRVRDMAFEL
jgi:sugar/nucleoside kinase (ribokinase family)